MHTAYSIYICNNNNKYFRVMMIKPIIYDFIHSLLPDTACFLLLYVNVCFSFRIRISLCSSVLSAQGLVPFATYSYWHSCALTTSGQFLILYPFIQTTECLIFRHKHKHICRYYYSCSSVDFV